jgi:predicted nucleic acid-binding protein
MAKNVIVDAGFLIALLGRRDLHHAWAVAQAPRYAPPWKSCEAVLSEAFHLLGVVGLSALCELLRRRKLVVDFELDKNLEEVLTLMQKYINVPMSLADACVVRMTETYADPILLTTDTDFRIYRRQRRQVIPCVLP